MILVTGGTGFIGSHLLDRLAAEDEPVRALVRRKRALPGSVEPVFADLAEAAGLTEALRGITTVIHLAGSVKVVRPEEYYRGNLRATENLARAAAGRGIRFVHVSSLAACGPCAGSAPVDEDATPAPITDYGRSKLEGELAARAAIPDAVIVRPPVVYGPRDTGVLSILKPVCRGIDLRIGYRDVRLSIVYVDDLVDGLLAAARTPAAAGRTYFVAHPAPVTWSALAETTARIVNRKPVRLHIPLPAAYGIGWVGETLAHLTGNAGFITREKVRQATQPSWVCDPRRAAAELGVRCDTPLVDGLERTLSWYKEAGWLKY